MRRRDYDNVPLWVWLLWLGGILGLLWLTCFVWGDHESAGAPGTPSTSTTEPGATSLAPMIQQR